MKYGFFDDLSREYVIQQPDTPLHGLIISVLIIFSL